MKNRQTLALAALALATSAVLGCSSGKDALEKRVASLQEEVVAVQNANDRLAERLMAIEMRQSHGATTQSARGATRAEEGGDDPVERPPLKVLKLGPGPQAAAGRKSADADPGEEAAESGEDEARPVIRDLGSGKSKARARATSSPMRQTGAAAAPVGGER